MIASGVFAGLFEKEFAWSRTDVSGKSLKEELRRTGFMGEQRCGDHAMAALLEAHIEQGPILENAGHQVGVVTGGQGQRWYDVTVKGQDSHAGSTPMKGRQDALVAAAELIVRVKQIALENAPLAVCTVGEMSVSPNSRNTIPGEVFLTVDIRNPDDGVLAMMADAFNQAVDSISGRLNVSIEAREIWYIPPVRFDPDCINAVSS